MTAVECGEIKSNSRKARVIEEEGVKHFAKVIFHCPKCGDRLSTVTPTNGTTQVFCFNCDTTIDVTLGLYSGYRYFEEAKE
jgi:transcription elongation factor Elf1